MQCPTCSSDLLEFVGGDGARFFNCWLCGEAEATVSPRPSMPVTYMKFAKLMSRRSTCAQRSVGAVITSADFEQVYSVGYNGNAKGRINGCDGLGWKDSCGCIHAEMNALIKCSTKDITKVMFITLAPCSLCAKMMVNSGFSLVYYAEDWKSADGLKILREAGIKVIKLPL